jgi:hypothetical protein
VLPPALQRALLRLVGEHLRAPPSAISTPGTAIITATITAIITAGTAAAPPLHRRCSAIITAIITAGTAAAPPLQR